LNFFLIGQNLIMEATREINNKSENILNFEFQDEHVLFPGYLDYVKARGLLPKKNFDGLRVISRNSDMKQCFIMLPKNTFFYKFNFKNNFMNLRKKITFFDTEKYKKYLDKNYEFEAIYYPDKTISTTIYVEPVPHVTTFFNMKYNLWEENVNKINVKRKELLRKSFSGLISFKLKKFYMDLYKSTLETRFSTSFRVQDNNTLKTDLGLEFSTLGNLQLATRISSKSKYTLHSQTELVFLFSILGHATQSITTEIDEHHGIHATALMNTNLKDWSSDCTVGLMYDPKEYHSKWRGKIKYNSENGVGLMVTSNLTEQIHLSIVMNQYNNNFNYGFELSYE
jgi:hypothetical protein